LATLHVSVSTGAALQRDQGLEQPTSTETLTNKASNPE